MIAPAFGLRLQSATGRTGNPARSQICRAANDLASGWFASRRASRVRVMRASALFDYLGENPFSLDRRGLL